MIDPKQLALGDGQLPSITVEGSESVSEGKAPRHRKGEHFLRGPIPWGWLQAASLASGHGSGFKVAAALWYLSGLNNQKATVKLSSSRLRELGVERHAGYRGLEKLENAGLVSVERNNGQNPIVTILDHRTGDGQQ